MLTRSHTLDPVHVEPQYMQYIREAVLPQLNAASRPIYEAFFLHARGFLAEALRESIVQQGFIVSGIHPFSPPALLSQCTTWPTLTTGEGRAAIAAVDSLALVVAANGQLSEKDLNEVAGGTIKAARDRVLEDWADSTRQQSAKPLEQRPLNHRRALHLTHACILQARKDMAAAAAEDEDDDETEVCVFA